MSIRLRNEQEAAEAEACRKVFDEYLGTTWGKCRDLAELSGLPRPIITKLRHGAIAQFSLDHAIAIEVGTKGELKAEQLLVSRGKKLLSYYRTGEFPDLKVAA